jgi:hypothetical protein
MICGVEATSISGCDVCAACRAVCNVIKMHGTTIKIKNLLLCLHVHSQKKLQRTS